MINKGCHSEVDSYSAFWDNNKLSQTELVKVLAEHKVTDVFVCGVAYEVCVGKYIRQEFTLFIHSHAFKPQFVTK